MTNHLPGFRHQIIVKTTINRPSKQNSIALICEIERYHLIQACDPCGKSNILRCHRDERGKVGVQVLSHRFSQPLGADGTFIVCALPSINLELSPVRSRARLLSDQRDIRVC